MTQAEDMVGLAGLAAKCEAASGADRELDGDIHALVDGWEKRWSKGFEAFQFWKGGRWIGLGSMPPYTFSIDAAMTLVPAGCYSISFNGFEYDISTGADPAEMVRAWRCWVTGADIPNFGGIARTQAAALCAAALRARAQNTGGGEPDTAGGMTPVPIVTLKQLSAKDVG